LERKALAESGFADRLSRFPVQVIDEIRAKFPEAGDEELNSTPRDALVAYPVIEKLRLDARED
jgi:hypothetical protein